MSAGHPTSTKVVPRAPTILESSQRQGGHLETSHPRPGSCPQARQPRHDGFRRISFRPGNLGGFILANILVSLSYGLIGALMALVVGRLGGAYLMLFVPMIDVGIFQDPMFVRRPAGLDESPARVRRDTIHDRFRIHSPG